MSAKKSPRKKKAGRPPTIGATVRIHMRASPEFVHNLKEWADAQPDKPSLSDAMRRLLEMQMSVKGKKE